MKRPRAHSGNLIEEEHPVPKKKKATQEELAAKIGTLKEKAKAAKEKAGGKTSDPSARKAKKKVKRAQRKLRAAKTYKTGGKKAKKEAAAAPASWSYAQESPMKRPVVLRTLGVAVILSSCTGPMQIAEPPAAVGPLPVAVSEPALTAAAGQVFRESGTASWYGADLHGRTAASGDVLDMHGMSAAHRTLPLGTVVRVTNLDNHKTTDVRISDRGPFVRSRVVELSYRAAGTLDFIREGTARVLIESLVLVRSDGIFTVQAASFVEEELAKLLKERLQAKYETVYIVPGETNLGKFFRVRVGLYQSEEKAERIAAKLALDGLEPVVLRKD